VLAGLTRNPNEACADAQCGLFSLVQEAEALASTALVTPKPVPPPEPEDEPPLYEARRAIYPQSVRGTFRNIKWTVLLVSLGIYYFLPFVRWDRGPTAPSQAVLVDFVNHRFYFFFIEIWPQEVYYLTGLLIIAAVALFLMNALAGRVWCGYLCPQTVWTDLFSIVERWTEGDRREHVLRDRAPWTFDKIARKAAKHFIWLMVAWWTGGAWVLYFDDAPTLVKDLATFEAPAIAYTWIGILTATTYIFAGHMREQVCLYMCPWPRIQAALTDEYALNVTYRYDRGEPRESFKKSEQLRAVGKPAGDCIDCMQCVNVCPTGVDIRGGANIGCIQCGLCIDACDSVMERLGRPTRLIAYDNEANIGRREAGQTAIYRLVRARTVIYAAVIAIVGAIMIYTLATRQAAGVSVIHDRNPVYVRLADGAVRNAFTVRILNKSLEAREFRLAFAGVTVASFEVIGEANGPAGNHEILVGPDQTREVRVLVTSYQYVPAEGAIPLVFIIIDTKSGLRAAANDFFRGP